jgi:hypothetical protein
LNWEGHGTSNDDEVHQVRLDAAFCDAALVCAVLASKEAETIKGLGRR